MKKTLFISALTSLLLLTGCGDGTGSSVSDANFNYDTSSIFGYSGATPTYKQYFTKATDDPIVHATIKALNCETYEEVGNGEYLLKKCIAKPTFIEVKDGIIQTADGNVTQTFPLLTKVLADQIDNFVVTPLTTILATANDQNISALAAKLGVSKEDLFSDTNEKVKKLFPKINAILITSYEQGAVTNKVKFLDIVRESVINNIQNDDINITKTLTEIKNKSMQDPNLFGLIIINNNTNINNDDPLSTIAKIQNSQQVRFYGLVFDKEIDNANITVYDKTDNKEFNISVSSDANGIWSFELDPNSELYNLIMDKTTDRVLQFVATKNSIKLTSTITTSKLRDLLTTSKLISPSKDKSLIISNITTAQDAILDKKGALNNALSYDSNLLELRVYYQDKILKAAAVIKDVVDNNNTSLLTQTDTNNTYDLIKDSIVDTQTIQFSDTINDTNTTDLETNITNSTILASQLNATTTTTTQNSFATAAENAQYTFYRLLAYYLPDKPHTDENFVREYTKIITYPSHYETQTCYIYGNATEYNETSLWKCDNPVVVENANFSNGFYEVYYNDSILTYSLDFNDSVYVPELGKTYKYYGVVENINDLSTGDVNTVPMIVVDNYDVVDAFRRMPQDDTEAFEDLKSKVDPYNSKEEVNFALNRFIKNFINDVKKYFEE